MKKRTITKILAGALAVAAVTGGAIAASNKKNVDIYYNGITIMIDGAEYVAKDANGNTVAPFIMDGTTYLPVRAVANAFDKDVDWDGKTNTVYIGKKGRMEPDNRLDKIQYVDYREVENYSALNIVNGTLNDFNGNTYTNGILFNLYEGSKVEVDYPLNGQYSSFSGKIVLPKSFDIAVGKDDKCKTMPTTVIIYGDEEEIYRATEVTASMPFSFDIDVDGVNMITIELMAETDYNDVLRVALTDLALYE